MGWASQVNNKLQRAPNNTGARSSTPGASALCTAGIRNSLTMGMGKTTGRKSRWSGEILKIWNRTLLKPDELLESLPNHERGTVSSGNFRPSFDKLRTNGKFYREVIYDPILMHPNQFPPFFPAALIKN